MHDIIVSVEINLGLVEFLPCQNFLHRCDKIIHHPWLGARATDINHEDKCVLGWGSCVNAMIRLRMLLFPSQNMVRGLGSLNALLIVLVVAHEGVLSTAYETDKHVFFYLVVIVHIGSANPTSRYFVDGFSLGLHLVWYWWQYYAYWQFETIVHHPITWHVTVRVLVTWWIILAKFRIGLKLFLLFCLTLWQFRLLLDKIAWLSGLDTWSLTRLLAFLTTLFQQPVYRHFVYLFVWSNYKLVQIDFFYYFECFLLLIGSFF